jgi:hypothetical protein
MTAGHVKPDEAPYPVASAIPDEIEDQRCDQQSQREHNQHGMYRMTKQLGSTFHTELPDVNQSISFVI